jgi:hypothetical protein
MCGMWPGCEGSCTDVLGDVQDVRRDRCAQGCWEDVRDIIPRQCQHPLADARDATPLLTSRSLARSSSLSAARARIIS